MDLEEEYAEVTFWLRAIPVGGGVLDPAEGSRPLPTKRTVKGVQAQTCGPGMPGPYGVVDGWRVLAGRCA